MTTFDDAVIGAVTRHMNDDPADGNLLIVRAFAEPEATAARMTGLDSEFGDCVATVDGVERAVRIAWPEALTDRASIRHQVVVLNNAAAERLGVEISDH